MVRESNQTLEAAKLNDRRIIVVVSRFLCNFIVSFWILDDTFSPLALGDDDDDGRGVCTLLLFFTGRPSWQFHFTL